LAVLLAKLCVTRYYQEVNDSKLAESGLKKKRGWIIRVNYFNSTWKNDDRLDFKSTRWTSYAIDHTICV